MKKKILVSLLAAALGMACVPAGIAAAETETAEETVQEELKTIGQEAEDALSVKLSNATGKGIKAVAVKKADAEEFGGNLLTEEDLFAADETRMLYYTPEADEPAEGEFPEEEAESEPQKYVVSLTFEDDVTAELHDFDFEDMEEAVIQEQDAVVYLVYQSVKDETEVSTLEAEQAVKSEAEQAAAGEAPAEIIFYDDVYYDDPSSGGSAGGAAPAGGGQAPAGDVCLEGGLLN